MSLGEYTLLMFDYTVRCGSRFDPGDDTREELRGFMKGEQEGGLFEEF